MTRQVVTISPDGSISGLQVKPGKGLDLTQFGSAKVERASEIMWQEASQRWSVEIVKGRWAGITLARGHCLDMLGHIPAGGAVNPDTLIVEFMTYDIAVAAEIEFLNAVRVKEGAASLQ